ncbi:hypothetical protein Dimus_007454 [Dionaea muscipula]
MDMCGEVEGGGFWLICFRHCWEGLRCLDADVMFHILELPYSTVWSTLSLRILAADILVGYLEAGWREEESTEDEESLQHLLPWICSTEPVDRNNDALEGGENSEGHSLSCPSAVAESSLMGVGPDRRNYCFEIEKFGVAPLLVENNCTGLENSLGQPILHSGMGRCNLNPHEDHLGIGWGPYSDSQLGLFSGGKLEVIIGPFEHSRIQSTPNRIGDREDDSDVQQQSLNTLDLILRQRPMPFLKRSRKMNRKGDSRVSSCSKNWLRTMEASQISARQFFMLKSRRKRRPGNSCTVKVAVGPVLQSLANLGAKKMKALNEA